ncbi:AAA domain-containing protein [Mycoplasmoides genitalium]
MNDWQWLKNRLVNSKTKSVSFWLPQTSSNIIDIAELIKCCSELKNTSINGLIDFLNQQDKLEFNLTRLKEIDVEDGKQLFGIETSVYKHFQNEIARFYKQVNKHFRETGSESLFLALPVIEGINEFNDIFRAPLLYVGVKLKVSPRFERFWLEINKEEIFLNPTIIGVETNKRNSLFKNNYDTTKIDVNDALKVFSELEYEFRMPLTSELKSFSKKAKSDFNTEKRTNYLINNVLLGIFDVKGDQLFQNFNEILNTDPDVLDELLKDRRDLLLENREFREQFDLKDTYLFSHLDIYQQYAVKQALLGDLIIEGPPGTGKSETIVNILVNLVLNNKKVLFVSEKVTALDVVYNRLGSFKHIALFNASVAAEKKRFYNQFAEFETYFTTYFSKKDLDATLPTFEGKWVDDILGAFQALQALYDTKINSGENLFSFKEIVSSFQMLDASYIKIKEYERFDEWVRVFSNPLWLEKHLSYQELKKELSQRWNGIDNFYQLQSLLNQTKKRKVLNYVLEHFEQFNTVISPKHVLFYKPSNKSQLLLKQLKQDVEQYTSLQRFQSPTKFETIKLNFINQVNENPTPWFFSWFIQFHAKPLLEKLVSFESNIIKTKQAYLNGIESYVASCKKLLKTTILNNFFQLYQTNKDELLEICRQAKNPVLKEITWWFKKHFELLKKLFPVHIMTLESAATLTPNQRGLYDYVVIDEASQVFLERAIPILFRADKYIIAGDTKQLKPANFFQSRAEYDVDEEFEDGNIEAAVHSSSLLHFLKNRSRILTLLKFHYRSDSADLIAFTNNRIYDNELIFMNKANADQRVFIVHDVIDGIWKNNRNLQEARDVVQRLEQLTTTNDYKKSLGVICFNKNQADLIEYLIDKQNNPLLNEWRERQNDVGEYEGLFVKNIENVQGDERDIIIFSLGYDRSVNSYGPISKQGGENRLNVAITRAKQRIELFKTNRGEDYNGLSSSSLGSKLLVEYLLYCEAMAKNQGEKITFQAVKRKETKAKYELAVENDFFNQLQAIFGGEFEIKRNVNEGAYFFSFVFYFNNIPYLAIDFNIPIPTSRKQVMEEILYREQFLKKRQWNLINIWMDEWKLNPIGVISKIRSSLAVHQNQHEEI